MAAWIYGCVDAGDTEACGLVMAILERSSDVVGMAGAGMSSGIMALAFHPKMHSLPRVRLYIN